jgi:hypothetical protein
LEVSDAGVQSGKWIPVATLVNSKIRYVAKQRRLHSKGRLIDMGDSTPLHSLRHGMSFARLPQGLVALKYIRTSEAHLVGQGRNYQNSALPVPSLEVHFGLLAARCVD